MVQFEVEGALIHTARCQLKRARVPNRFNGFRGEKPLKRLKAEAISPITALKRGVNEKATHLQTEPQPFTETLCVISVCDG